MLVDLCSDEVQRRDSKQIENFTRDAAGRTGSDRGLDRARQVVLSR